MSYFNDIPGNLCPSSKTNENIVPFSFFFCLFYVLLFTCIKAYKHNFGSWLASYMCCTQYLPSYVSLSTFIAQAIPLLILYPFWLVASPPLCCPFSTCSCSPRCLFNSQLVPNWCHNHLLLPWHPANHVLESRKAASSACRFPVIRHKDRVKSHK